MRKVIDKERLKICKQLYLEMMSYVEDGEVIDYPKYDEAALEFADNHHIEWLIGQAKTLEKCAERNEELEADNYNMDVEMEKIYKQNKRYREALIKIANEDTYTMTPKDIALEALEDNNHV